MPGRLGFSQQEWVQVLALYRLEQQSYDKCPTCMNKDKHLVRTCFYCGAKYSNADNAHDHDEGAPANEDGQDAMHDAVDLFLGGKPAKSTAVSMARERATGDRTKAEQRADAKAKFAETLKHGGNNGE